jgi:hypothetical protein
MKKIAIVTLSMALLLNFPAMAQENPEKQENFLKHKSEIITSLTKEKSIIESSISCINSASKKEDIKNCHSKKKSEMDSLREERKAAREKMSSERKAKLEEGIKRIDEKQKERLSKSKPDSSEGDFAE